MSEEKPACALVLKSGYVCNRPAEYLLGVGNKPCGHAYKQFHVCAQCWREVAQDPDHKWRCGVTNCRKRYVVTDCLLDWKPLPSPTPTTEGAST